MGNRLNHRRTRESGEKSQSIAYSIPLSFGLVLNVRPSANAWWMDRQKVNTLIAAFCISATIEQACSYAGITLRQYKYFIEIYPEFTEARRGYVLIPETKAQTTIIKAIERGDIRTARWYLAKTNPKVWGSPSRQKQGPRAKVASVISPTEPEDPEYEDAIRKATGEYHKKLKAILFEKIRRGDDVTARESDVIKDQEEQKERLPFYDPDNGIF